MVTERGAALTRTLDLLGELLGRDRRRRIDQSLANARVRLVVDGDDLAQARTQSGFYVLVSLLVRSGLSLEAEFAQVPRLVDLPGLSGPSFGAAITGAVPRMFPGATLTAPTAQPDVVIAFGAARAPEGRGVVRISSVERTARITRGPASSGAWAPSSSLAALAAAGLGAGEALKDVLRPICVEPVEVLAALEPSFRVPVPTPDNVALGQLFAISAGAINQQFLLVLLAEESVSGAIVLLDCDLAALSNANRCPFVMIDELGRPKVDAIQLYMPDRLSLTPIPRHLDGTTLSLLPEGSSIVVGADDIAVRHVAQRLNPSCLTIGATSHFMAMVTEHPAGEPCAGCAHRVLGEDIGVLPTWSIVSFWGGFLLALRVIARASGRPYSASRRVTNFWPLRPEAVFEHELAYSTVCPVDDHGPLTRARLRPPRRLGRWPSYSGRA